MSAALNLNLAAKRRGSPASSAQKHFLRLCPSRVSFIPHSLDKPHQLPSDGPKLGRVFDSTATAARRTHIQRPKPRAPAPAPRRLPPPSNLRSSVGSTPYRPCTQIYYRRTSHNAQSNREPPATLTLATASDGAPEG